MLQRIDSGVLVECCCLVLVAWQRFSGGLILVCCSIVVACFLGREKDLSEGASRVDEKRAFSFPFKCPRCFY